MINAHLKMKDRKVKDVLLRGECQWEGEGE
jgi:hypothetical protein